MFVQRFQLYSKMIRNWFYGSIHINIRQFEIELIGSMLSIAFQTLPFGIFTTTMLRY
mgnify:CR=1 FL=1